MDCTLKLLLASLLLVCIFHGGCAEECTTSSLSLSQRSVGGANGLLVYEVEVDNNCICVQSSVLLRCAGFNTTVPINPTIFRPQGDGLCVLNDFGPVIQGVPVQFKYSWPSKFDLGIDSSYINCS